MNKFIGIGRLTKDVEVRFSQGEKQTAIASFSVAIDRKFKRDGEPDADFFNCTAFGKTAEFIEKYFSKGMKLAFTGRLTNDNYTKQDGTKVYGVKIVVEDAEFCEKKGNSSVETSPQSNEKPADGFINVKDGIEEELPFS